MVTYLITGDNIGMCIDRFTEVRHRKLSFDTDVCLIPFDEAC